METVEELKLIINNLNNKLNEKRSYKSRPKKLTVDMKQYRKDYYQKNKEKSLKYCNDYYHKNREIILEVAKEKYLRDKELN